MKRRNLLKSAGVAAAAAVVPRAFAQAPGPKILLRNAWQSINIGDVAHTLGMLRLLKDYAPTSPVVLWPSGMTDEVAGLLRQVYPDLPILANSDKTGLTAAIAECDYLLHGSGSGFVAAAQVERWRNETGKRFGVFGISLFETDAHDVALLSEADFLYFRDSQSLDFAQQNGVDAPIMEFGPDSVFSFDNPLDEVSTTLFMAEHGLDTGRFMCCIPRYRWTPTWEYRTERPVDPVKQARNAEMVEHDHQPLLQAITEVVRRTGMKVLICPEDVTQVQLGRTALYERLPDDVKGKVVWRDRFWLPDEALATYRRSVGVFGNELHSAIMSIGSGIPAIVCRFKEQNTKGLMWRDIGLGDWLFDLDQPDGFSRIAETVVGIALAPDEAKARATAARELVRAEHRVMMMTLEQSLASL